MLEAINEEASRVQAELAEVEQRLAASRDVLERTLITAPTDGTVVELRFRTEGGVIRPGEPILEIVPRDEELLVDARLAPIDIDVVRAGLPGADRPAGVPAAPHAPDRGTRAPGLRGCPHRPPERERFFEVQVEVDPAQLAALEPEIKLAAGHAGRGLHHDRRAHRARLSAGPALREPAPRLPRALRRTELRLGAGGSTRSVAGPSSDRPKRTGLGPSRCGTGGCRLPGGPFRRIRPWSDAPS